MPLGGSPDAADRPKRTIRAARTLAARADAVARVCADARADEIIVAVINPDGVFGGAWVIPRAHLHERASRLPGGGWSLTFAPQTTREQIEARCDDLAHIAGRRWRIIQGRSGKS